MLATKHSTRQRYPTPSSDSSNSDEFNDSDITEDIKNRRYQNSMDSFLKYIVKLTSPQIVSLALCRLTVFVNVFFISLAGYYHIESFENT